MNVLRFRNEYSLFFILITATVLIMFAAVIATPTLSFDDLFIAKSMPQFLMADGWGKTIWWALTLPDVGQINVRTYGLTRLIQLLTVSLFGASPALTMGFIVTVHCASGLLVYNLLTRAIGDKVSSALLAIAWVASPAVIPTIRAEHHWLYLIAPYYALIGWLVLNETRCCSILRFCAGSVLLTSVWFLGEAPIIPLAAVCFWWMVTSPNWRKAFYIGGQAVISLVLLGGYLAYQWTFNHNSNRPQRFASGGFTISEVPVFFWKLWENAKGIVGLPYLELDGGKQVPSFHVADRWGVWVLLAILLVAWFSIGSIGKVRSRIKVSKPLIGSIWLMWIGSLAVYFVLVLLQATVFPMRYTTAFFLFTPIGLALGVSVLSRDLSFCRSVAAIVACLTVAFSTALALRYEYKINKPNRTYLAKMKGVGLIVYYPETPGFVKGKEPNPTYPGLVPANSPGYGDPKSTIWMLAPMLELYAGAVVGSECRFTQDGKVEILQGQNMSGIRPQDQVMIVGSEKALGEICDAP